MAKRFGRNQKRRLMNKLESHEAEIQMLKSYSSLLIAQRESAKERAFAEYAAKHQFIQQAVRQIYVELGRSLSREIEPHARKLLQSSRQPIFDVTAIGGMSAMTDREVTVIEGCIPSLHYRLHVM